MIGSSKARSYLSGILIRRPRPINLIRKLYHLRRLLHGRRVLIIGSGPSVIDLPNRLPNDMVILTCNLSPLMMLKKNLTHIDLYLTHLGCFQKKPEVEELLEHFSIDTIVIDTLRFLRSRKKIRYNTAIHDSWRDTWYLDNLVGRRDLAAICPAGVKPCISSGVRLLQYALYFGAQEIYLLGIDISDEGYFYADGPIKNAHKYLDNFFAHRVAEQHKEIFVASKKSPLADYIAYKEIA